MISQADVVKAQRPGWVGSHHPDSRSVIPPAGPYLVEAWLELKRAANCKDLGLWSCVLGFLVPLDRWAASCGACSSSAGSRSTS